jgi:ketosteroid isomerase-like protein
VEIVRRMTEAAFSAEEPERALDSLDPEVEFDLTGRPDGKVWYGREGVAQAMMEWIDAFESWEVKTERYIDAGGDQVVSLWRERGRGKTSGLPIEQAGGTVFTVRQGKIVKMVSYLGHERPLEVVGLSE